MGIAIGISIILLWAAHLAYMLFFVSFSATNPWMYLHILIQSYLYTGLFITGHDAMHGNISKKTVINTVLGNLAVFLFAGMSYKRLRKNHGLHHKYVASEKDPDFSAKSQNFFAWWAVFMWRYLTISQLVIMAVIFNIFIYFFPDWSELKILTYWALPAILGTFQLFYTGVYWPHREPHTSDMGIHKARTQKKNHLWAMISCYFFGYHQEHHKDQHIPWWQLYKTK